MTLALCGVSSPVFRSWTRRFASLTLLTARLVAVSLGHLGTASAPGLPPTNELPVHD